MIDRFEPARLVVEVAQIVVHEADEPDALAHLCDADILAGEHVTEIDLPPLEADPAAGRSRLYCDEGIEAGLLLEDIGRGRLGRFLLQREMHSLVPSVLLRMARRDAFSFNPEAQPPDRELAEPVEGVRRRELRAVVGADPHGSPNSWYSLSSCRWAWIENPCSCSLEETRTYKTAVRLLRPLESLHSRVNNRVTRWPEFPGRRPQEDEAIVRAVGVERGADTVE